MVRSVFMALALAFASISPGQPAVAQEATTTHVVVAGETLESLAERYLGDHQRWPEIARLNPDVTDPNRIEVGVELLIPASVMGVNSDAEERIELVEQADAREPQPGRSVFYGTDLSSRRMVQVQEAEEPDHLAVAEGVFYSAEWLVPGTGRPTGSGSLGDFVVMPEARRFQGQTARPFDRVTLNLSEGFVPQVGQELQVFRVSREVPGLGWVMRPTGSVTVVKEQDGATIAEVNRNVAPMTLGDLIRPVPRFPLRPGDMAEDVELGSMVATIIGWGEPHQLPQYGDIAFLDLGSRDGVSAGDEFVVATRTADGFYDDLAGRLQVVSTSEDVSSARIIQMDGAVFSLGIEVFLDKKMR